MTKLREDQIAEGAIFEQKMNPIKSHFKEPSILVFSCMRTFNLESQNKLHS